MVNVRKYSFKFFIQGVFIILSKYWIMVPSEVIKAIFKIFLTVLVYDVSTVGVRMEVVKVSAFSGHGSVNMAQIVTSMQSMLRSYKSGRERAVFQFFASINLLHQGLTLLLDCVDAVPFLSQVLPQLGNVFDDVNAGVREAFARLLLKVKESKALK